MSTRAALWTGFVLVHVTVAALGFLLPNQPMGDVYLVYEPWSAAAVAGEGVVGVTADWVYPQLALLPMLLAHVPGDLVGAYPLGWAILVAAADAAAFAVLVGRGRSRGRVRAAWFWLIAALALGPVGMYRIDAVTVPLAVLACLWLAGRPWAASVLLAAATWVKVWPAALLAAAFVAVRRRWAIAGGALAVSVAVVAAVLVAGGGAHLFGFVAGQTGRGLQIEAPAATPYLWGAVAGADGFGLYYDRDMLTFQATGPGVAAVAAMTTPLMAVLAAAILLVGAWQVRRGIPFVRLFPVLALALVLTLIVTNKVGSPQFETWLLPVVVFALAVDRRRWQVLAAAVVAVCALTQLVYPILYGGVLTPEPIAVTVLTARNLLLIALLVWMTVRLVRPAPAARRA